MGEWMVDWVLRIAVFDFHVFGTALTINLNTIGTYIFFNYLVK